MKLLVCGSRDYTDEAHIEAVLAEYVPQEPMLIQGGARGADMLAATVAATRYGWDVDTWPADWKRYGKGAGPIRNQLMLDVTRPDLVVAFGTGKGTEDCVRRATQRGIPVRREP